MKLKKLHIENYKNLIDFDLNFENDNGLSIIVGNNGSGKSNILEAISGIFCEWYGKVKYTFPCDYSLSYDYDGRLITLRREGKQKFFFENEVLYDDSPCLWLPSNVIALYSGEDMRLWEDFYRQTYLQYFIDSFAGKSVRMGMYYVNKYLWNISLFTMLLFSDDMQDIKDFLKTEIGIEDTNRIDKITINFNFDRYKENQNRLVKAFIEKINPKSKTEITKTLAEWKNCISSYDIFFEANSNEVFNLLMQAFMPKDYKIITNIEIIFANGLTLESLSEGEKKLILTKAVLEFVADENSILLFDEPDANIHEARKFALYNLLKKYNNRQTIITSHSPSLVKNAYSNELKYLENRNGKTEVITDDKLELIKKLASDQWNIVEAGIYLQSEKPLVLFEGKSDIDCVVRAIDLLKEDNSNYKLINVDFLSFNGTSNAVPFIEDLILLTNNRKIIVFCDNDSAGKEAIKAIKKMKKNFIHCELYPIPEGVNEKQFLLEDYFTKDKIKSIINKKISEIKHPYKDLPKLGSCIKSEIQDNYKSYPKEDFEGFKVLLDKIYEMTKE